MLCDWHSIRSGQRNNSPGQKIDMSNRALWNIDRGSMMPGVVTAECLVHNISYMYVESMGTSQGRYGMLFHVLDHSDRASLFEFGHHKCSGHLSSRSLQESITPGLPPGSIILGYTLPDTNRRKRPPPLSREAGCVRTCRRRRPTIDANMRFLMPTTATRTKRLAWLLLTLTQSHWG